MTIGASAENDLQLNPNTAGIQVGISEIDTANYIWHINFIKLLGKSISITSTDEALPMNREILLFQKSGYSSSGKILSSDSYMNPLKEISITVNGVKKEDYDNSYSFLIHPDISFTNGTFEYTDVLSDVCFGKFTQADTKITGNGYYDCSIILNFKEIG